MISQSRQLSLVIPSTPNEYRYLPGILDAYAAGIEKPDEVIITMSNAHQIWRSELNNLEAMGERLFDRFKLLRHQRRLTHGPNRQAAIEHCSHAIVSFFDSDDLPYPNRIAVLKQVFDTPEIIHVNHCYTYLGEPLVEMDYSTPPILAGARDLLQAYFPHGEFADCRKVTGAYGGGLAVTYNPEFLGVTAGHVTVRNTVFDQVGWLGLSDLHEGFAEDYQFNMECLYTFRQSVIINLPLTQYRVGHKTGNSIKRLCNRSYRATVGRINLMRSNDCDRSTYLSGEHNPKG